MFTKRQRFSLLSIALALMLAAPAPLLAQTAANPPAGAPQTQVPQPDEGGVNWSGAGFGALTVLADVVYVPVKLVYAMLGGIVGGGAWAVTGGNTQVANTVWRSSLGGDYVLTPSMLQGKDPINFSGPTQTAPDSGSPAPPVSSAPAPVTNPGPSASNVQAGPAVTGSAAAPASGSGPVSEKIDAGSGPVSSPGDRGIE